MEGKAEDSDQRGQDLERLWTDGLLRLLHLDNGTPAAYSLYSLSTQRVICGLAALASSRSFSER